MEYKGIIVFPLQYIELDNYYDSYLIGKDMSDNIIKLFIRPNNEDVLRAQSSGSTTIPLIENFADTSRRAQNPCFAQKDNGKFNPIGVILTEQTHHIGSEVIEFCDQQISVNVYECKWASNLRENEDMPTPAIGVGYVEITYNYPKNDAQNYSRIKSLIKEYNNFSKISSISALDKSEQLQRMYEKITAERSKIFTAVILKHKEIEEKISDFSENGFRAKLEEMSNKYTKNGRYGMVLIRVRKGDVVISSACTEYVQGFNYAKKVICTAEENWKSFLDYKFSKLSPWLSNQDVSIDFIPAQRINTAYHGKEMMGNDFFPLSPASHLLPPTKYVKQFIDKSCYFNPSIDLVKESCFLASMIGIRMAKIQKGTDRGNELISNIHSFSTVIGNPFEVRYNLKTPYTMDKKINKKEEIKYQQQA
jgi:hypothetical protein